MRTLPLCMLGRLRALAVSLALLVVLGAPAHAQDADRSAPASAGAASADRLLVGVVQGAERAEVAATLAAEGLTLGRYWPRFGVAEALTPPTVNAASDFTAPRRDAIAARSPLIRYVTLDERIYAAASEPPLQEPVPNDPMFAQQWALPKIRAVKSWNITHGDPDVVIAVIDGGYHPNHPDLADTNLWTNRAEADGIPGVDDDGNGYVDDIHGWDWVDDDNAPNDWYGHGMHVLGTVAATTGNAVGISGAGRSLRVAPLRILNGPYGNISDLVDAIAYAIDMDMSIINLSLTGGDNTPMRDAIIEATSAGLLVVAASGNSGSTPVFWPARYPETVAVAATDSQDQRASFSSYGPEVTVAAPGADILSLYPANSYYSRLNGTSMATPHVSALLGLLRSLRPDLSNNELVALMTSTAADVNSAAYPGDDIYLGAGRIDYYAALLAASAGLTLTTDPAALQAVAAGHPLDLDVLVKASGLPVEGAVVYLQMFQTASADAAANTDAAAAITTLRQFTGSGGRAAFSLTAPTQPGDYTLRVQVGSSARNLPVKVTQPLIIRVALADVELAVGGDQSPFTVTVSDNNNIPIADPLNMRLETDLGLVNGQSVLNTVIENGVFTDTLRSGSLAGSGTLSATIGLATGATHFTFLPGPPARLSFNEFPDRIVTDLDNTFITLSVRLMDAYDNLVDSSASVSFTASTGDVSPALSATSSGVASTTVTVPRTLTTPVVVYAEVPEYPDLRAQIEVLPIPPLIWFPFTRLD